MHSIKTARELARRDRMWRVTTGETLADSAETRAMRKEQPQDEKSTDSDRDEQTETPRATGATHGGP